MGNPTIELTIDINESDRPAPCTPYVWVILIEGVDGCAVDVDFYTADEAPRRLKEFESAMASYGLALDVYEATACKLSGIDGAEAEDAIALAINRYFYTPGLDDSDYALPRDVDFRLTTAWDGHTDCFTLSAATRDIV